MLALIDDVITIPDEVILQACRTLLDVQHLVAEPAGAAALAGAHSIREKLVGRSIVLLVCGGNLTPALLGRAQGLDSLI